MKCDRKACEANAVQIAEGLDPARPVSSRCESHAWTPDEIRQIFSFALRTKVMLDGLTTEERAFLVAAPPSDRQQILEALVRDAPVA